MGETPRALVSGGPIQDSKAEGLSWFVSGAPIQTKASGTVVSVSDSADTAQSLRLPINAVENARARLSTVVVDPL